MTHHAPVVSFLSVVLCAWSVHALEGAPEFELWQTLPAPVIGEAVGKGEHGIMHGFEGGFFLRTEEDGMYHLFPSECMDDRKGLPWDVHMESHHWVSADGRTNWTRQELTYESSASYNGTDRRSAIWAPVVLWNAEENRWNMFYVGYTAGPHAGYSQVDGAIFRLVSQTDGRAGIAGPYPSSNATMILNMDGIGGKPEPWEGALPQGQGDDSFFAWQLDNGTWAGFYGSHERQGPQDRTWKVGLVMAPKLAGPWERLPWLNPAEYIESPEGIENPIVTRTMDGKWFVAVFDPLLHGPTVGITYSSDGLHWSKASYVDLNASSSGCGGVRTPQGLVPEPKMCAGCYSMLYTGSDNVYENECWVLLRNKAEAEAATFDRVLV